VYYIYVSLLLGPGCYGFRRLSF